MSETSRLTNVFQNTPATLPVSFDQQRWLGPQLCTPLHSLRNLTDAGFGLVPGNPNTGGGVHVEGGNRLLKKSSRASGKTPGLVK